VGDEPLIGDTPEDHAEGDLEGRPVGEGEVDAQVAEQDILGQLPCFQYPILRC
jgi:hypothetical protein